MQKLFKTLLFGSLFLSLAFAISFCAKEESVKTAPQIVDNETSAESRSGTFHQIRATVTLKKPSEVTEVWVTTNQSDIVPAYAAHFKPSFSVHCVGFPVFNLGNPSAGLPTQNAGGGYPATSWGVVGGGNCGTPIYGIDPVTGGKVITSWIAPKGIEDIKVAGAGNVLTVKLETIPIGSSKAADTKILTFDGPPLGSPVGTVTTYKPVSYQYQSWSGLFI
jgi:hypothetical protein